MVHRLRVFSCCGVVLASVCLASAGLADSGIFRSAPLSQVGSRPTALAVGDVDDDGNLDVVVTSTGGADNRIIIGVGRGNATFGAFPPGISVGTLPGELTLADLDGDNIADLAVVNTNSATVTILLGEGSRPRFFGPPGSPIAVGGAPVDVVAADLNGDSVPDLVTANEVTEGSSGTVSVLLGLGDGSFGRVDHDPDEEGVDDLVGELGTSTVAVVDIDGDTNLDILALNRISESLSVFLGNGNGTFGDPSVQDLPGVQHFSLADFDGNGEFDLVGTLTDLDRIEVRLGNGDGTFGAGVAYRVGSAPIRVAAEEVTGDGVIDLIAANSRSQDVSVLQGNGDGTFASARTYVADAEPRRLAFGDFDGDDRKDVAVVSEGSSGATVAILRGRADGGFFASEDLLADAKPKELASGDIDGDGVVDLAGVTGGPRMFFFRSSASRGLGERVDIVLGGSTRSLALADFDGDLRLDAVVSDIENGEVVLLRGQPDGTLLETERLDPGPQPGPVVFGDFNADGRVDVATALVEDGEVSVFLQSANGSFAAAIRSPATLTGMRGTPNQMKVIDADCRRGDDLVVANDAINTVVFLTSDGNGSMTISQELDPQIVGDRPGSMVVADFDSDGRQDVAVSNTRAAGRQPSVRFYYGGCDGTFDTGVPSDNLFAGDQVTAITGRDFTGDQIIDIGLVNQTSNAAKAFIGQGQNGMGDGSFRVRSSDTVSRMPEAIASGDFDDDGRYDMAVGNTDASANNVTFLPNCSRDPGCVIFLGGDPEGVAANRGDGNDDGAISAADIAAVAAEVIDGDGDQIEDIEMGTFGAAAGVDSNGDGRVDEQDARAVARRIFSSSAG